MATQSGKHGGFKLNPSGVGDILKSSETVAKLRAEAEKVAAAARASAPVASGAYRDSIEVTDEVHASRAVARVTANISYGMLVESRTGNLARALGASSGTLGRR